MALLLWLSNKTHTASLPFWAAVGWLWLDAQGPPNSLHCAPPKLERKNVESLVGQDKEGQGGISLQLLSQTKQTQGKIRVIYCQSN